MPTGLEKPMGKNSFANLVKAVNRMHAASSAESRRRRNAKLKTEAAKRAAALEKKHLIEENAAVRALLFKISTAERAVATAVQNPTPKNISKAEKALGAMQRPGSFTKGRFRVYNSGP
jgi:Mn-dependent DtxR family transcriptional regulator